MDYATIWAWIVRNKRTIITIIVIIILLFIIKTNWYKIRKLLNPQAEDNVPEALQDPNQPDGISPARKIYIEGIASDIYNDIDGWSWYPGSHDYEPYASANALYDDEIQYLGKYYRDYLSKGSKLSDEIDAEYYQWSDGPTTLKNKLRSYNL